jgi:predicted DNA-binding ribbon-helix-helix protein
MLIRTNIYLKETMVKDLKRQAKEQKTTVSKLIREAIDEKKIKSKKTLSHLLKHAKKHNQKSKIKDLARNHDKYLLNFS